MPTALSEHQQHQDKDKDKDSSLLSPKGAKKLFHSKKDKDSKRTLSTSNSDGKQSGLSSSGRVTSPVTVNPARNSDPFINENSSTTNVTPISGFQIGAKPASSPRSFVTTGPLSPRKKEADEPVFYFFCVLLFCRFLSPSYFFFRKTLFLHFFLSFEKLFFSIYFLSFLFFFPFPLSFPFPLTVFFPFVFLSFSSISFHLFLG